MQNIELGQDDYRSNGNDNAKEDTGFFKKIEKIDMVLVILGMCILFFIISALLGGSKKSGVLITLGANYPDYIQRGEIWRFITSLFLHAGMIHLIVNFYSFYILGRFVEKIFGRTRLFTAFIICGFAASFISYLFTVGLSIGASGGVAGLLGMLFAFTLKHWSVLNEKFRKSFMTNIFIIVLINLFISITHSGIDNWAHLGGFLTGCVLGIIYMPAGFLRVPMITKSSGFGGVSIIVSMIISYVFLGFYLLYALVIPYKSGTVFFKEKNKLFQISYPKYFNMIIKKKESKYYYFTNHHNITVLLNFLNETEFKKRLNLLNNSNINIGNYKINGMNIIKSEWKDVIDEGEFYYYQVIVKGPKNSSGDGKYAVFIIGSSKKPISLLKRKVMDKLISNFYFIYSGII